MHKHTFRSASVLRLFAFFCLAACLAPACAEKMLTLETPRYRVGYAKKHAQLAGEILKVAEAVWPTLSKA